MESYQSSRSLKAVSTKWITDSVEQKMRLSELEYSLMPDKPGSTLLNYFQQETKPCTKTPTKEKVKENVVIKESIIAPKLLVKKRKKVDTEAIDSFPVAQSLTEYKSVKIL